MGLQWKEVAPSVLAVSHHLAETKLLKLSFIIPGCNFKLLLGHEQLCCKAACATALAVNNMKWMQHQIMPTEIRQTPFKKVDKNTTKLGGMVTVAGSHSVRRSVAQSYWDLEKDDNEQEYWNCSDHKCIL